MAATMKAHPSLPLALTGWPRQSLALARDSRRFDVVQRAAPRCRGRHATAALGRRRARRPGPHAV